MQHSISTNQIAVLGAGSWGTALATLLAYNNLQVHLWGHEEHHIANLLQDRENRLFLPGIKLASTIYPTTNLKIALKVANDILIVVPSHAFKTVLEQIKPFFKPSQGISWATKGFHSKNGYLLHQVATEILGNTHPLAVISGPTFAQEVAQKLPTAITIASKHREYAHRIASYLHTSYFRAYTSNDLIGVQVGGATKNVLAIATGIADGLGYGANTRAALITRGLVELTKFGVALGGSAPTFYGLAGLGDLALTCTDNQSRNRRLGLYLAKGLSIQQACREIAQEVEGIQAAYAVFYKSQELGIEMPICEQVYRILYQQVRPQDAVQILLERSMKQEIA